MACKVCENYYGECVCAPLWRRAVARWLRLVKEDRFAIYVWLGLWALIALAWLAGKQTP